jgi:hypothetical protein
MTELIADLDRCRLDPDACPTVQMDPGESRKLQEFLQGMDSAAERRTAAAVAPRTFTLPSGETVIDGEAAHDTDPEVQKSLPLALQVAAAPLVRTATRRKATSRRPRKLNRTIIATVVMIAAIVAALVLLYVFRENLGQSSQPGTAGVFEFGPVDSGPAVARGPASAARWPSCRA